MMGRNDIQRDQDGFSLVELMVGMVLGLLLIAGAVSIYLASKRSYVEVEQVAALTENARFAEQILGDSLRHAGFFGEVAANRVEKDPNLTAVAGDCTGLASAHDLQQVVFAATADGSGNALGCVTDAVPGTDVLVIKHALPVPYSDGPREGADPNDPTYHDGVIDTPSGLQNDRTYVMTNGVSGLMFDGADTPPSITIGGQIPGGTAWEYQYEVYYVRDPDPSSNVEPTQLSRKLLSWNGAAMQLTTEDVAEGVERIRVLFGYDQAGNDGEVDKYSNVDNVANWAQVESVEVFMLIRSATSDSQYSDDKQYKLGDLTINPLNDNFRRLLSHTSVSLRNLKLMIRGEA